jgi:hypothetical protein
MQPQISPLHLQDKDYTAANMYANFFQTKPYYAQLKIQKDKDNCPPSNDDMRGYQKFYDSV